MIDDRSVADRLQSVLQQQPSAEASQNAPTLYAQVYSAVREALLSGLLAPGELLSLRVVAAALGISPMPVREALGRLMIEGALESLPNRAFRVPFVTAKQFRELLLMRVRLETLACEHASVRAGAHELLSLRRYFEELTTAASTKSDVANYLFAHRRFHFEIYKLADMPKLYTAIETLWLRMGPLFNEASVTFDYNEERKYHAELLRALELSDPKAAAVAIENDLTFAGQRTMQLLEGRERDADVIGSPSVKLEDASA